MKNFLYVLSILLNTIGIIISLALFFYINSYFPIILASVIIFAGSFTVTLLDNERKKIAMNFFMRKKITSESKYFPINDYREYFTNQKTDFIIL